MGTLYYTQSEKAKRQTTSGVHSTVLVTEYSVLTKPVLFFSANASPHWTIFATSS
jgi:hypothetical protein